MKEKVLELISKYGIIGISIKEIHKELKIKVENIHKITSELRTEKKIYYSKSSAKWKLIEYMTTDEKLSNLEWSAS